MNHPFKDIYNNRSYGIYVHGVNRFVLIDSDDIWVTMKTAQAISSKAVTSVCVLPQNSNITNDNCLNYTIEHEGEALNISVVRQIPQLRIYDQNESIVELGPTVEGNSDMLRLNEFVAYIHRVEYVLTFFEVLFNTFSNREVAMRFFNDQRLITTADKSSLSLGIVNEVRRIVYFAQSVGELKDKICLRFYELPINDKIYFKKFILEFYEMLGENLPVNLEHMRTVWE